MCCYIYVLNISTYDTIDFYIGLKSFTTFATGMLCFEKNSFPQNSLEHNVLRMFLGQFGTNWNNVFFGRFRIHILWNKTSVARS